jgi:hypothetical protein
MRTAVSDQRSAVSTSKKLPVISGPLSAREKTLYADCRLLPADLLFGLRTADSRLLTTF